MPEISRFFGIIIRMFYNDHEPAHFHALYGEDEALIEVETLAVLRGSLPRLGAGAGMGGDPPAGAAPGLATRSVGRGARADRAVGLG
jgi:hypothetical protein